jgi:hypothetical protein
MGDHPKHCGKKIKILKMYSKEWKDVIEGRCPSCGCYLVCTRKTKKRWSILIKNEK